MYVKTTFRISVFDYLVTGLDVAETFLIVVLATREIEVVLAGEASFVDEDANKVLDAMVSVDVDTSVIKVVVATSAITRFSSNGTSVVGTLALT